jgi:hypothetical protein
VARTEQAPVRAVAQSRDALDFLYREVLHRDLASTAAVARPGEPGAARPPLRPAHRREPLTPSPLTTGGFSRSPYSSVIRGPKNKDLRKTLQ